MTFEEQVRAAIAAVPHTDKVCESVTDGAIKCDSCYCDREQRIAQLVAFAIEAGMREVWRSKETPHLRGKDGPWYDAAVRALRFGRWGVRGVRGPAQP